MVNLKSVKIFFRNMFWENSYQKIDPNITDSHERFKAIINARMSGKTFRYDNLFSLSAWIVSLFALLVSIMK